MAVDCPQKHSNLQRCNCTYSACDKTGQCCECLHFHLGMQELPGCCFPDDVEKTYDRSFENFIRTWSSKLHLK